MTEFANSYAAIIKSEKQDDGTLKVYGKATDDSLDIDQQICDDEWLKKAMPDWFTTGGNIREQHSNIAAGVATEYEAKSERHYITAHVVDKESVKKVELGVLKGFSIGIRGPRVVRDTKAAGGRIIDGQIVEVSLVDRPANPNAKLMLAKAAENGELMSVEQVNIPLPNEVFKNLEVEPETVVVEETPVVEETVVEETVEVVTEDVTVEETVVEESLGADELIETAKSFVATLNKFDQVAFDTARRALSDLIVAEANEMSEMGSNEKDSIEELLDSVKHLFAWYEGEIVEGETVASVDTVLESMTLSADTDMDKMCNKCDKAISLCECDSEESEEEDSAMGTEAEKSVTVDDSTVAAIIEKAVASTKEIVETEIALLKSSIIEAEQKATDLAAELEVAKKAAASGGPKRASLKTDSATPNELLQKAAEYRNKAASTLDKTLVEGYREIAAELEAKAKKVEN